MLADDHLNDTFPFSLKRDFFEDPTVGIRNNAVSRMLNH